MATAELLFLLWVELLKLAEVPVFREVLRDQRRSRPTNDGRSNDSAVTGFTLANTKKLPRSLSFIFGRTDLSVQTLTLADVFCSFCPLPLTVASFVD